MKGYAIIIRTVTGARLVAWFPSYASAKQVLDGYLKPLALKLELNCYYDIIKQDSDSIYQYAANHL